MFDVRAYHAGFGAKVLAGNFDQRVSGDATGCLFMDSAGRECFVFWSGAFVIGG